MKLVQNEETRNYCLSLIDQNELELLRCSLNAVHELLISTPLDNLTDNQEKDNRIKRVEALLEEITALNGSRTAESWDSSIMKKILEKYIKC